MVNLVYDLQNVSILLSANYFEVAGGISFEGLSHIGVEGKWTIFIMYTICLSYNLCLVCLSCVGAASAADKIDPRISLPLWKLTSRYFPNLKLWNFSMFQQFKKELKDYKLSREECSSFTLGMSKCSIFSEIVLQYLLRSICYFLSVCRNEQSVSQPKRLFLHISFSLKGE